MQTASNAMTRDPIVVRSDTQLGACLRMLMKHGLRHLPVVDAQGVLVGLVRDHQLLAPGGMVWDHHHVCGRMDPARAVLSAMDVAHPNVLAVEPDTPILSILAAFDAGEDAAVVVDGARRPVGILTEHDALRMAVEQLPPWLEVRELATPLPLRVPVRTAVSEALEILQEQGIRHLLVVTRGRVVAVVSYRDLAAAALSGREASVGDLRKAAYVYTLGPRARAREAARLMVREKIGCLPVVGSRKLLGLLTRTDLVRSLGRVLHREGGAGTPPGTGARRGEPAV